MAKALAEHVAGLIDHALLHPTLSDAQLEQGLLAVAALPLAAVCIKPCAVPLAAKLLAHTDIAVCTVVGFPHGSAQIEAKVHEAALACAAGATEIDMVVNVGKVLSEDWDYIARELRALREVCSRHGALLKVIFENDYLPKDHFKIRLCEISAAERADFVKTSTGFGFVQTEDGHYSYRGATAEDVALMRRHCPPEVQIKAAGGIRSLHEVLKFEALGCSRIGASATLAIVEEARRRMKGEAASGEVAEGY